jgi:hypothetical protein
MNIVQQIQCKKEFSQWLEGKSLPTKKYPVYKERVYRLFERLWKRRNNIK